MSENSTPKMNKIMEFNLLTNYDLYMNKEIMSVYDEELNMCFDCEHHMDVYKDIHAYVKGGVFDQDTINRMLEDAVSVKDYTLATMMIDYKADVNYINPNYDYSLLSYTIMNQDMDMFYLLVDNGADISFKRKSDGYTLLHLAAKYSRSVIAARYLILNGIDINGVTSDGNTPIQIAINRFNDNIVNLLITKGADMSVVNDKNETLIDIALRSTRYIAYNIYKIGISTDEDKTNELLSKINNE